MDNQPSNAFIMASWLALVVGMSAYLIGLWNAEVMLSEKGYYFAILMYGLFAAASVQKNVRDIMEGISVSGLYVGISWFSVILTIALMVIGLWNSGIERSEKGFFAMAFILSLFAAVAVGKNTRDFVAASSPEISEEE
jgi:uncharacterized membrane protein YiaA